jgi:hypothetical protein
VPKYLGTGFLYGWNSNFGGTMISIKFLAGFQLESFLEMGAVLSVPNPGVFRKGWQTMIVLLLSLAGFVLLQSELVFPVSLFL